MGMRIGLSVYEVFTGAGCKKKPECGVTGATDGQWLDRSYFS